MAAVTLGFGLVAGGALEIGFAALNAAIYAAIGVGLWRANEKVWALLLILLGPLAAFQGAMLLATRDVMLALPFVLNVTTIVALIWAGRQLGPEPTDASPGASA